MSEHQRKRCWACLGRLSCFTVSKGTKRIVPASRLQGGTNGAPHQQTGAQAAAVSANRTTVAPLSLLAPPSSPASFINSTGQSTAESPCNQPSLSSPISSHVSPSPTMFTTGPYAHETQLVSPPVFSTFTTEPSTAPLTPPPESSHLTTPSSPDVPFARFLSSSSPGNPFYGPRPEPEGRISSLPAAPAAPNYPRNRTGVAVSQDTNFFFPATNAQLYTEESPSAHAVGGRLSFSREEEERNGGDQEAEEIEAYRISFGFSADEVAVPPPRYTEVSEGADISFVVAAPSSCSGAEEEREVHPFGVDPVPKWHNRCTKLAERKRKQVFPPPLSYDPFSPTGKGWKYWSSDAEIEYGKCDVRSGVIKRDQ